MDTFIKLVLAWMTPTSSLPTSNLFGTWIRDRSINMGGGGAGGFSGGAAYFFASFEGGAAQFFARTVGGATYFFARKSEN